MQEHMPFTESFHIGATKRVGEATTPLTPGKLTLDDRALQEPLYGMVENQGSADFTFSLEQSDDNGDTDAYAAVNMRVQGANVASVTVVPGARVVFTVEAATKKWLKMQVAEATAYGLAAISYWLGKVTRMEAYPDA
jgi:hypothetical protein